ncbi:protein of unknown function [Pararobbsia alpina]
MYEQIEIRLPYVVSIVPTLGVVQLRTTQALIEATACRRKNKNT